MKLESGTESGDEMNLAGTTRLGHSVSVYVPSQSDGRRIPNRDELLLAVCDNLTELCGGVTVTEGAGVWKNGLGEHVRESVSIATAFTDSIDDVKAAAVLAIAVKLKADATQESVAFQLDGELYLV